MIDDFFVSFLWLRVSFRISQILYGVYAKFSRKEIKDWLIIASVIWGR